MDDVVGYAATVVLLRDGELGVEVLLAERPHDRGSFAGAWVFPGGAVDPDDVDGDGGTDSAHAARRAAVRETREEVGLDVDPDELVAFAHWTPPAVTEKRFVTTFFAARVPDGTIRPAPDEVIAVEWIRPVTALERHAQGAMRLWPPTWVTLHGLQHAGSVDEALAELRARDIRPYVSRIDRDRSMVLWSEDHEYDLDAAPADSPDPAAAADTADTAPARHRLEMGRLPWVYLNSV